MVERWGTGRSDYSTEIVRTVIPTIKGEQGHYWGVLKTSISPFSYIKLGLEKGFSKTDEWVPSGKKFILNRAEVSSDVDSLICFKVYRETKTGDETLVGATWGHQHATIESSRSHYWTENTRPIYRIENWNATEQINIYLNIYGILEKVI